MWSLPRLKKHYTICKTRRDANPDARCNCKELDKQMLLDAARRMEVLKPDAANKI